MAALDISAFAPAIERKAVIGNAVTESQRLGSSIQNLPVYKARQQDGRALAKLAKLGGTCRLSETGKLVFKGSGKAKVYARRAKNRLLLELQPPISGVVGGMRIVQRSSGLMYRVADVNKHFVWVSQGNVAIPIPVAVFMKPGYYAFSEHVETTKQIENHGGNGDA